MVDASLFIPLVIIALTQFIKMAIPQVKGWVTIIIAFFVGLLIALVDQLIGIVDISIAQGLVYALGAIGISVIAGKAGGGASGDQNTVR